MDADVGLQSILAEISSRKRLPGQACTSTCLTADDDNIWVDPFPPPQSLVIEVISLTLTPVSDIFMVPKQHYLI